MPAGLEIYRDGAGVPYFDTIAGYVLGSQALALAAGASGSIADASLADGIPFFFIQAADYRDDLQITFTAGHVNYSAPDGFNGTLFWGIR